MCLILHLWYLYVLNLLVNHKNTKLKANTKIQASNRHILRVLGRFYSLIHSAQPCRRERFRSIKIIHTKKIEFLQHFFQIKSNQNRIFRTLQFLHCNKVDKPFK